MKRTRALALVAALLALVPGSGCMFKVEHALPARTYFGHLPRAGDERAQPFRASGMKNWALAGIVPWSSWGTADLVPTSPRIRRVEDVIVETRFSTLDTIIWVIPGFAYGYYLWAPRTIQLEGNRIYPREGPQ